MAKTSRDARRHIQALSEFLSTGGVSREAMEEILKKSEKRKYLKQSVRRLVEKGFISEDDSGYAPTIKGTRLFRKFSPERERKTAVPAIWDEKWRLVTFDVPCRDNKKRYQIRSVLKEFNFCQLQKSVWICPNSLSKNFWKTMVEEDLNGYCKTMVVDVIEGEGELKSRFRLS